MVSAKISTVAAIAASSVVANTHVERNNAISDGIQGGATNYRQTVDTLTRQLQNHDGHAAADVISATITGLDSQIDNGIATISNALAPLTGGLSLAVGQALLGPFAQSVTNGAEVVLSNLIGAPIDFISEGARTGFANSLSHFAKTANRYNVDTTRMQALSAKLRTGSYAVRHHKRELVERQNAIIDGYHSGLVNSQQTIDTLTRQLQSNNGHAGADVVTAVLTGLDSQIDNGIATVSQALSPLTGGLSMAVGNFLLGPFVQAVTNGAEVAIGNVVGGGADLIAAPVRASLSNSLTNLIGQANQYNVNTQRLSVLNKQLRHTLSKTKRAMDGAQGSVTNYRQTIDTLTRQLQSHDGHAAADIISATITGLDSQIDNGIATIADSLAPLTGGLSLAVGQALLGPFAQSVTNGAEVVLSNLIGAPIDFVTEAARTGFANNLSRVAQTAGRYNVDTSRLHTLSTQIRNRGSSRAHGAAHSH